MRVDWVGFVGELLVRCNQLVWRDLPNRFEHSVSDGRQVVDRMVEVVCHTLRYVLDRVWSR